MKKVTNLSSRVFVMLCAALLLSGVLASSTQAQAARPLDDVLEDWQDYDWDWIIDVAGWEAQNDGPLYPSAPPTVPQYETFEGDFTPEDANTKLAIFSDDGCDVYINGAKVHSQLSQGQSLPNLSQSLHKIAYSFQSGVTYQIKVVYSNTKFTGQTDIDGASLFAYSEGATNPPPDPPTETPDREWAVGDALANGIITAPQNDITVSPGQEVWCEISDVTDSDNWNDGAEAGSGVDSINYLWAGTSDTFQGSKEGQSAVWIAPLQTGTYTITVTASDEGRVPQGDSGVRDDAENIEHTVTVHVATTVWHAGRDLAETKESIKNGRLIAPQDQRGDAASWQNQIITMAAGATIVCTVEPATDWDRLTQNGQSSEEQDVVNYLWASSNNSGSFDHIDQEKVRWTAPNSPGQVTLTCTIDDKPTALEEGQTGTRDDEPPMVRTVTINVVAAPKVEFTEGLINNTVRLCAGGVDDYQVTDHQYRSHTTTITAHATRDGQSLDSAPFTFSFKDNVFHDYGPNTTHYTARLLHDVNQTNHDAKWKETITHSTNNQGNIALVMKSSDVISRPTIEAYWTDPQGNSVLVGSVSCDFAEATRVRRFPNEFDPDEDEDDGWIFNAPYLDTENKVTPAKLYLKFKIDPSKGDDYVDEQGKGNWKFVNGHQVLMKIDSVQLQAAEGQVYGQEITGTPTELKNYAIVMNAPNGPSSADEMTAFRTTEADGATPQVYVKAGSDIDQIETIWVGAEDKTQWNE